MTIVVNGKHERVENGYIFTIGEVIKARDLSCRQDSCKEKITVYIGDHISNRPMWCDSDHPYLVWYSPEKDTYMVSSN